MPIRVCLNQVSWSYAHWRPQSRVASLLHSHADARLRCCQNTIKAYLYNVYLWQLFHIRSKDTIIIILLTITLWTTISSSISVSIFPFPSFPLAPIFIVVSKIVAQYIATWNLVMYRLARLTFDRDRAESPREVYKGLVYIREQNVYNAYYSVRCLVLRKDCFTQPVCTIINT